MAIGGTFYAFDLGRAAGWCKGQPGDPPVSGSYTLYKNAEGIEQGFANFIAVLQEKFEEDRPTAVFCSTPPPPAAAKAMGSSAAALRSLYGYRAILAGITLRYGAYFKEIAEATARKHFLGKGRLGKADAARGHNIKDLVVQRAQLIQAIPPGCFDEDRADAICIWDWATATYGRRSPSRDRLFLFGEQFRAAPAAAKRRRR